MRTHGWVGLGIIAVAEALLLARRADGRRLVHADRVDRLRALRGRPGGASHRSLLSDDRPRRGRARRPRVHRLLVAVRAVQRAAILARRRRCRRPLVAVPRPRAEPVPAAHRVRLVLRDDFPGAVPHGRRAARRRVPPCARAPAGVRRRGLLQLAMAAGAVCVVAAARRRVALARAARLDRLGAAARAAELPPRPAVVARGPRRRATPRACSRSWRAARSAACCGSSGTTGRRRGGRTRCRTSAASRSSRCRCSATSASRPSRSSATPCTTGCAGGLAPGRRPSVAACYNPARHAALAPTLPRRSSMKAIRVNTPGGPEVLRYEDVPEPDAQGRRGHGEGRRRRASTTSTSTSAHRPVQAELPLTLGLEAGGTVTAVGPNVTEVKVGDKVAYTGVPGAYAQYAAVPAARLVSCPTGLSTRQGAAAMLQGMTAHYLACSTYPLKSGRHLPRPRRGRRCRAAPLPDREDAGRPRDRDRVHRGQGQARARGRRRRRHPLHEAGLRGRGEAADRRQGRCRSSTTRSARRRSTRASTAWRRAG